MPSDTIHEAARTGDLERVRELLDADPSQLNRRDTDGWPPLWHAARNGRIEVVVELLARGADVALGEGEVVHQAALAPNQHEMVDLLLAHRALEYYTRPANDEQRWFFAAVFADAAEQVEGMLADNPDLATLPDGHGTTMFYHACAHGDLDVMRPLHECGADVNRVDAHGRSPLYAAAVHGHPEAVRELLAWGADPAAKLGDGRTAAEWVRPHAQKNDAALECLHLLEAATGKKPV